MVGITYFRGRVDDMRVIKGVIPGSQKRWKALLLLIGFLFVLWVPIAQAQDTVSDEEEEYVQEEDPQLILGKKIYEQRCLVCHGREGNGKGYVGVIRRMERSGRLMEVRPRDFTLGVFRFRTTPTGCLPTDADLQMIIKNGIPKSFMPSRKDLTDEERTAVMEYLRTFSERWEEEDPCDPIAMKEPDWVGSDVSVRKGMQVYKKMKCWECHGNDGRGDGPKSDKLKDDWGKPILPFDFTTGPLKRGATPEDVYITFTTGLDGTGMPSYEDSLSEEERWNLVSYTLKLMAPGGESGK